ncbi:hypothetical protein [Amycolatopsis minnesotensis]|uniref:Uncharacterized protein n=1 Tax=Amycolatopsis minnesotensis TaxID=337894 RepID=A0ABN2RQP3_9PSEU
MNHVEAFANGLAEDPIRPLEALQNSAPALCTTCWTFSTIGIDLGTVFAAGVTSDACHTHHADGVDVVDPSIVQGRSAAALLSMRAG